MKRYEFTRTDTRPLATIGEVFGGPEHSFFGRVKKNTGAFAEVRYSF